jgi:putative IMPACT (imprinted ancient) family translation regulator
LGKFGSFFSKRTIVVAGASKASKTHAQPVQQEESNQKMKDDTRKKTEIKRHNWSAHRTNVVEDVQVPDRILADDVAQNGTLNLHFP